MQTARQLNPSLVKLDAGHSYMKLSYERLQNSTTPLVRECCARHLEKNASRNTLFSVA